MATGRPRGRPRHDPPPGQFGLDGTETPALDQTGETGLSAKTRGRPSNASAKIEDGTRLVVDTARLARVLGLSVSRVQQLRRDEGLPGVGRGRWDLEEVVPWFVERERERVKPVDGTALDAQRRLYLARAATAELEHEERRGDVFSADTLETVLTQWASAVRATLQGYPALFDDPGERSIADKLMRACLERLAGAVEGLDVSSSDLRETLSPPQRPKRKPVGRPRTVTTR